MAQSLVNVRISHGGAREIARDLRAFSRDAAMVSDRYATFLPEYEGKWIAFHAGRLRASALSLARLLREVDGLGLPRQSTVVRFITATERTMIL